MKTAKSDTQNETKCLETRNVFKMSREVLSLALKFTYPIHPESSVTIKKLIKPNVPLFQSFSIFQIIKKQICQAKLLSRIPRLWCKVKFQYHDFILK